MSNWTQALCEGCWNNRNPTRRAVRTDDGEEEKCCDCGKPTKSGIFIRQNPQLVNHPRQERADR